MDRWRLKLKQLDFISAVDEPAQQTAKTLLIKRKGDVSKTYARVAKVDDELGLVFCWAFTSKVAGRDYYDLHGDTITPDFIKACAEFMEGSRAVDEMHDGNAIGKTVFGMPMTPEIAKAFFGFEVDTVGFMVAIKPGADALAKFKSGEYSGVSIAGWGEREKLAAKARVDKGVTVYTTLVDGHQHTINLECFYDGAGYTSHNKADGEEYGHSHSVVLADGKITILADAGHTHDLAEDQTAVVMVPADAVVVVANQAPPTTDDKLTVRAIARGAANLARSKSTTANAIPTVKSESKPFEENPMDANTKIAELEKRGSALMKMLTLALLMPEAHRAHAATLGDDAESFLAKSASEREAIVKAAVEADPVHYTAKSGRVFRQSERELGDMAKRLDDSDAAIAKRDVELENERLEKRASLEFAGLGEPAVIVDILKGAKALDEKRRDAVEHLLKSAKAALELAAKMQGVDPEKPATDGDPIAKWNAAVKAYAEKHKIADEGDALVKFLGTTEGQVAKRQYDATRAYGKHLA